MPQTLLARESAEYVEILSEVFAEIVRKSTIPSESTASADVTQSLVQCLQYVYLHGLSPVGKIASGLDVSIPAASQLVDRLVQKSLVSRQHSDKDRRLARVELTDKGRRIVLENRDARLKWLRDILMRMPENNRKALVDSVECFIQAALETTGNFGEACVRCGIDHLAFCVVNKSCKEATGKSMQEY